MTSNGEFHRLLPFLALVGTAVGVVVANFNYFIKEHTGHEKDYISRLPSDILCHIISYLELNDAIRTSILSRSWRKLYCILPNLKFDYHKMYKERSLHKIVDLATRTGSSYCHRYKLRFVTDVDKFLQLHSGIPVKSFALRFCMMKEFHVHLLRWLSFIVRFGVRHVDLRFDCDNTVFPVTMDMLHVVPFNIFLSACMLESLNLSFCCLEPKIQGISMSLKRLYLDFIPLFKGEVETILLSCPQLRFLKLRYCSLPYKFSVNSLELRMLIIIACRRHLREIGVSAPNLEYFSYMRNCGLSFLPSHVPNLRKLFLDLEFFDRPHGFVGFICGAPCLQKLWVRGSVVQVQNLQMEMPTLSLQNLDRLVLHVIKGSLDLRNIISMIAVYPNLTRLKLSTINCSLSYEETNAEVLPTFGHLKSVKLDGFKFDIARKIFVSRIVRCAPALKYMEIDTAYSFYCSGRMLEETLPLSKRVFSDELISRTEQQLKQQASSSSLVIRFIRIAMES